MKTYLLLLFLLWVGIRVSGQEDIKTGGNYYFNYPTTESLMDFKNETVIKEGASLENVKNEVEGSIFNIHVQNIKKDRVYFVFGNFSGKISELENKINKNFIASKPNEESDYKTVYSLPLVDFKDNTKPLYNIVDWRVGVFTVPFKLRLSEFSFDANVNLGANLGAKFRMNRKIKNGFSLEPIVGFGLASIKLDESNSKTSESTNISAFTINTGLLIHVNNSINVGFTYGFDHISKNDQNNYDWKYNGKGWLGLGINVAFSSQNDNTGSSVSNSGK
ncbi:MAG: hypothetical protein LBE92_16665 [Chryseobacterium sp.]|jgi:opacity protein-like surface antigen|uniref:hypothetical protein n=1 Tax=Chryseobacterium sp. TaxID=1871047 RepID=UPI00283383E2|nr:hypothetical protein [Chryseobacterium sp.]MDR2237757.1 hypothetical protein [Chryseobacterium sp.]